MDQDSLNRNSSRRIWDGIKEFVKIWTEKDCHIEITNLGF